MKSQEAVPYEAPRSLFLPLPRDGEALSTDAHITTRGAGVIIAACSGAEHWLGASTGALCGRRLVELLPPAHADHFERFQRAFDANPRAIHSRVYPLRLPHPSWGERSGSLHAFSNGDDRTHWTLRNETPLIRLRQRLQEATRDLEHVGAQERQRLSEDLHDDVSQLLSLVAIQLRELESQVPSPHAPAIRVIEETLREASEHVTSLTFQLHPPVLFQEGLAEALDWLCATLRRTHGLVVTSSCKGDFETLDETERTFVFRAVRELLINVAKHAESLRAYLEIVREQEEICATVEDEGLGVRPQDLGKGYGLQCIGERARGLGGALEVKKRAAGGTVAVIRIPVSADPGV